MYNICVNIVTKNDTAVALGEASSCWQRNTTTIPSARLALLRDFWTTLCGPMQLMLPYMLILT